MNRLLEENGKLKDQIKDIKTGTFDKQAESKKDVNKLLSQNKLLEKQKNELHNGFKKAIKLIDILKKQKMHLESATLLGFSEQEFLKVMETKLG